MIKTKHTPIWVFLAFSAIESRKGARILIAASLIFTVYCLPWSTLTGSSSDSLVNTLFLIDDWSWIAMMVPICIWYIASLYWMDKHNGWEKRPAGFDGELS